MKKRETRLAIPRASRVVRHLHGVPFPLHRLCDLPQPERLSDRRRADRWRRCARLSRSARRCAVCCRGDASAWPRASPAPQPGRGRRVFWAALAISAVIFGCALAACWPGGVSYDASNQWRQAHCGEFNNWHPVFHTLLIWLVTRVWDSYPFAVVRADCRVFRGHGLSDRHAPPAGRARLAGAGRARAGVRVAPRAKHPDVSGQGQRHDRRRAGAHGAGRQHAAYAGRVAEARRATPSASA